MTHPLTSRTVTAGELAGSVGALLTAAEHGERIVVTRRGRPVAVLGPAEPGAYAADALPLAEETAAQYAVAGPGGTAGPQMPSATALARLVGTPAMRAVMALFLTDATLALHQREIARRAGLGLRSAQIALQRLTAAGVLGTRRDGNRLYYTAERTEGFERLRELMSREIGIAEVIARHLTAARVPVVSALIFGSVAAGTDTLSSDIDLLVVSDAPADALVRPIADAQRELGREIDLVHYRVADFERRRREHNHFVDAVLAAPHVDVMGSSGAT